MSLHALSGFGTFAALTKGIPFLSFNPLAADEHVLIEHYNYLFKMVDNEHRGIRIVAVEALVTFIEIQLDSGPRPSLMVSIENTVQELIRRLSAETASLYRTVC